MNKIDWFKEELDKYYGHDNDGHIYGIDLGEDIVWYKTKKERDEEYGREGSVI